MTKYNLSVRQLMQASSVAICLCVTGNTANAGVINWNTWTGNSTGTLATFSTLNSHADVAVYPSYTPSTTFADGVVVNNAPVAANGIMQLFGGNNNVNTITFNPSVVNPVFAIWSLGQGGLPASFDFTATPVFVSGGPSFEYAGYSISVLGNVVSGEEGNGTVQFVGTFSSISWTNPTYENWYGFNVGAPASVPDGGTTLAMLGVAMAGMAWARRKVS